LSKPILTAKVTLLIVSKQSFTGFVFFERVNSPSLPANELEKIKNESVKSVKIFSF
jgi:hypothetical protein